MPNTIPLNVLVVDDSKLTQKKISKVLEDLGHTIVGTARTGAEAIEQYAVKNPDVVTMDITMPDMDGIEATKGIVAKFNDALIVMVTSHGQEQMVLDALKSGAKGYVLKPVQKVKLQEVLEQVIGKYMR